MCQRCNANTSCAEPVIVRYDTSQRHRILAVCTECGMLKAKFVRDYPQYNRTLFPRRLKLDPYFYYLNEHDGVRFIDYLNTETNISSYVSSTRNVRSLIV